MARKNLAVRPIPGGMSTDTPSLYQSVVTSPYVQNCRVDQRSLKKRPGYLLDRSIGSKIYDISLFQIYDGTRFTLYLTATDLIARESAGTFSYKTETYTTGAVDNVGAGDDDTVTGVATSWTGNVAAGDKFVMDVDHDATEAVNEPDEHWATVDSVDGDTQITLTGDYTGTMGFTGNYKIRKVYSVPANERWSTAVVGDQFIFTNGEVNVQTFTGTGYAADLNAVSAVKARYCIEYANRLILADYFVDGLRAPYAWAWSKEGDPSDWTDTTAGSADILETEGFITGLGKVGGSLIIFKPDAMHIFDRTGVSTAPFSLLKERRGIGCVAPYSIANFMSACAFIGRDDFYLMDGDQPKSIGGPIRQFFFENVGETEVKRTFALVNHNMNEVMWVASGADEKYAFVYNYRYQEWTIYTWADDITSYGKGAV